MLTCNIGKERKMDKHRKIKAMTLSLNPRIQSLILHINTIVEDSSLHSSGENCDTKLALKDRKNGQVKGRIKARSPILIRTIQQRIVHVYPSFNILDLKVPEKFPKQIFNVNMLYSERKKNG